MRMRIRSTAHQRDERTSRRPFRAAAAAVLVAATAAVVGVASASATTTPSFSATDVATCGGSSTVTVTIDAQNPPPVEQVADIVLLVDDSGSIGYTNFNQVRASLGALISDAAPSLGGNHIGIVEFSTGAHNVTPTYDASPGALLSDGSTLQAIVASNASMPYSGGWTYTLDGLQAAETMLTGSSARTGKPKVIIVETDGRWQGPSQVITDAQDPTSYAASLASSGTQIFAVGVGSQVSIPDLTAIAGGDSSHVFSISDYSGLTTALHQALLEAIPAATNLSYSATPTSDWTITGASASAGTAAISSGDLSWSLPSINSPTPTSVTITYTEQHTGSTGGPAVPLASAATLAYTDETGTPQTVDYSNKTVSVSGCAPTSKDQCKHGGWQALADDNGIPFKNQGDCVSYVATKGKNTASG